MKLWQGDDELQDIVFLGLFFGPILAVILFHSELYDGWRQLYFIYPAFLLLATKGWMVLWSTGPTRHWYKTSLIVLTTISVMSTAMWMWKAHPMECVYFNRLAGNNVKARYEMDYWGVGTRKALEYILEHDDSPVVNVWSVNGGWIESNVAILKPADRQRVLIETEERVPYYVLNNYRGVGDTDNVELRQEYELFYEIKVDREVVLSVFKWKGVRSVAGSS
jgi:hypothetical protein